MKRDTLTEPFGPKVTLDVLSVLTGLCCSGDYLYYELEPADYGSDQFVLVGVRELTRLEVDGIEEDKLVRKMGF